jgi:hypothetical protein
MSPLNQQNIQSSFYGIKNSLLFKKTVIKFIGKERVETITRPACFFVRLKKEGDKIIKRIIVLPPYGFTGDKIDLLNPHPEARKAKIKILGKINPTRKGFSPITREVKFNFSTIRNIPTEKNSAYSKSPQKHCKSELKSWKNWFYVVKESGWGNFHSLINLSNEWVVMFLEKELTDQKKINLYPYLKKLPRQKSEKLQIYLKEIEESGDSIFTNKVLIHKFLKYPSHILVPILIQMLNLQETGKHENCTFFALLLKIAKKNKKLVSEKVDRAIILKSAPYYYLDNLKNKLKI